MTELLKKSIVRILAENCKVVGAGFLVGDDQIVTCAHVIRDALGLPWPNPNPPEADIHLDFPFIDQGKVVKAKVVHWDPRDSGIGNDIAGLKLAGYPPRDVKFSHLDAGADRDRWGHRFRSLGFPKGHDNGVWVSGEVLDERADGWVQLVDPRVPGKSVEGGFSGGPVWDDELSAVIGMIASVDKEPGVKVAFMIPSQVILDSWSDLDQKSVDTRYRDIPIVIVAMTESEANEVIASQSLPDALSQENPEVWAAQYKGDRNAWVPPTGTDWSIRQIIGDMVFDINSWRTENGNPELIRTKFVSKDFFDTGNQEEQENIWGELEESGGIIIVDSVSLFHPFIEEVLSQAKVCHRRKVAVLGIAPVSMDTHNMSHILEGKIGKRFQRSLNRFAGRFEELCVFGMNYLPAIEHWLFRVLQKTASGAQGIQWDPNTLRKFRRQSRWKRQGIGVLATRGEPQR